MQIILPQCILCNQKINKVSFKSLLNDDILCIKCRDDFKLSKKIVSVYGIKIKTYYKYNSNFKKALLQYKQCYDEALSDLFLYEIKDYINFRYNGYKLVIVPSTNANIQSRGFNHMEKCLQCIKLEKIYIKLKIELDQKDKTKKDRKKIIDNFIYDGPKLNKALIIDDVLTTGSTIYGIYKALKPYCKKIECIALSSQ